MNAGRIYALVLRIAADKKNARDLTKRIFITTLEQISFFRDDMSFASWLIGIAVYTALEALRNNGDLVDEKVAKKKFFGRNKHEESRESPAGEVTFEENILSLPSRERIAFILHDMEEYTKEETADILFVNKSGLDEILTRARKLLEPSGAFIDSIQTIKSKISQLPARIEPPADLWKEIFTEIHRMRSSTVQAQKVNVSDTEEAEENDFSKIKKKKGHWAGDLKSLTGEIPVSEDSKGFLTRIKKFLKK